MTGVLATGVNRRWVDDDDDDKEAGVAACGEMEMVACLAPGAFGDVIGDVISVAGAKDSVTVPAG